jgi:hypothetical protein
MDRIDLNDIFPTRLRAEDMLLEAAHCNPGPWEAHSRYVALGAERIATQLPQLDPERAYILGLLHDIGRREGAHGLRHTLDGYRFLTSAGFSGPARSCITHTFPIQNLVAGADRWDGTAEEFDFVCDYLKAIRYTDYDRLVQLLDCLALPSGFCLMEKRLVDVVMRYGTNEHTLPRWNGFFAVKDHLEAAIGGSVYSLLPGVVENTFDL